MQVHVGLGADFLSDLFSGACAEYGLIMPATRWKQLSPSGPRFLASFCAYGYVYVREQDS